MKCSKLCAKPDMRYIQQLGGVLITLNKLNSHVLQWETQGAYKNDMIGLEFDPLMPGDPKVKGEDIITKMLGIQLDHSKWWDLAAVIFILISYRFLFFAILKLKERGSPMFRTFYTKRTLKHLKRRPSFNKIPSFPSKRHQPLHSLSSQEGLNSPMHQMQQQNYNFDLQFFSIGPQFCMQQLMIMRK